MTEAAKQFQNENIRVEVLKEPHCLVKFAITVSPLATKAAHSKALKNVSKEVSLPGFRKGRAPEPLLNKQFGKQIDREFRDIVLNTAFKEALSLVQVYPYQEKGSIRHAECNRCSLEEGAFVSVHFESFPEVPNVERSALHISSVTPEEVSEEDIQNEIEQMLYHYAEWEQVENRPVQEGDFADLHIVALENGQEREICANTRFLATHDKMPPWLYTLVNGLEVNQSAEGMSAPDPREKRPVENFKPTLCRVTVKSIHIAKLPELDDALAAKAGAPTVEELRQKIQKRLETDRKEEAQEKMRDLAEERLNALYLFDLPLSLIDGEKKARYRHKLNWLNRQSHLSQEERDQKQKELENEAEKEAEKALRLQFLIYKVIQDQKIQISHHEILQECVRQLTLPEDQRIYQPTASEEEQERMMDIIRQTLLFRKALDHLIESAQ